MLCHLQWEAIKAFSSLCCCQTQAKNCNCTSAMLDKVTSMKFIASASMVWFKQVSVFIFCVKKEMMKALAHFMVKRVFGSDRIITGTIENYKSESTIEN